MGGKEKLTKASQEIQIGSEKMGFYILGLDLAGQQPDERVRLFRPNCPLHDPEDFPGQLRVLVGPEVAPALVTLHGATIYPLQAKASCCLAIHPSLSGILSLSAFCLQSMASLLLLLIGHLDPCCFLFSPAKLLNPLPLWGGLSPHCAAGKSHCDQADVVRQTEL